MLRLRLSRFAITRRYIHLSDPSMHRASYDTYLSKFLLSKIYFPENRNYAQHTYIGTQPGDARGVNADAPLRLNGTSQDLLLAYVESP